MTEELDDACARLARLFPTVDREALSALLLDCYRLVARHTYERQMDTAENLCKLRLKVLVGGPATAGTARR